MSKKEKNYIKLIIFFIIFSVLVILVNCYTTIEIKRTNDIDITIKSKKHHRDSLDVDTLYQYRKHKDKRK